jgi:hypothetical protein
MTENLPDRPSSVKGRVRAAMWMLVKAATDERGWGHIRRPFTFEAEYTASVFGSEFTRLDESIAQNVKAFQAGL